MPCGDVWCLTDCWRRITGADYSVRGKGGPVNVVDPDVTNAVNPLTTAWLKGCREAGLPMSADYNTRKFATFGFMQVGACVCLMLVPSYTRALPRPHPAR